MRKFKVEQAHRKLVDAFASDGSIQDINQKITNVIDISDKAVELAVDLSSKNAWESTLTTYLCNPGRR